MPSLLGSWPHKGGTPIKLTRVHECRIPTKKHKMKNIGLKHGNNLNHHQESCRQLQLKVPTTQLIQTSFALMLKSDHRTGESTKGKQL